MDEAELGLQDRHVDVAGPSKVVRDLWGWRILCDPGLCLTVAEEPLLLTAFGELSIAQWRSFSRIRDN